MVFFSKAVKKIWLVIFVFVFFVGCTITKKNIVRYEKDKNIAGLIEIYNANPSLKLRYWALKSIGRLRDSDALTSLMKGLKENHWVFREEAAYGLGELGDPKAIPDLIQALNDQSILVRLEATNAIIRIGKKNDTANIEAALYDPDSELRRKVAYILGCIRNKKSLPALWEAIDDPNISVRQSVISALSKFGDDVAIGLLIKTLKDSQWEVRRQAAVSLGQLGRFEAVEQLKPLVKYDPNNQVKRDSKKAVEMISKNITRTKCNRCHTYYEAIAEKRTPEEWKEIIDKMINKDKNWINKNEVALITDYLIEYESILNIKEETESKKLLACLPSHLVKKL